VSASDFEERDSFGDLESFPTGLQRSVKILRCRDLRFDREVVASQEEQPDILEHHFPERNGGRWCICRICRYRSSLFQDLYVTRNVRSEGYFDDVIDSHCLTLILALQVIGAVLFLANRYVALALALLAPVIVNILCF
jgi:hypothetical protein